MSKHGKATVLANSTQIHRNATSGQVGIDNAAAWTAVALLHNISFGTTFICGLFLDMTVYMF